MVKKTKPEFKLGKAGLWIRVVMKKRGMTDLGAFSGALGLNSACIRKAMQADKIPKLVLTRIQSKWKIDVPLHLLEEEEEGEKESDSDNQGRSPPNKKILRLFSEFLNLYQELVTDIIVPQKIIQERDSQWGKELRKRRSTLINSTIFHLPTIKALYLMNIQEIKKRFPKQTIANLISGVPMEDQVYLKFCRVTQVSIKEILHPSLRNLLSHIPMLEKKE